MSYAVKFGDTIGDAILNSTGVIGNWSAVLDENDFDSWTPDLIAGSQVEIPATAQTDLEAVRALKNYPASNSSSQVTYGLIEQIFTKLLSVSPVQAPSIQQQVIDLNSYYKARYGETIGDVILNSTGNIDNWEDVLDENNFNEWTPQLTAGQLIAIPPTVQKDLNVFRALTTYPANNNSESDVYGQIDAIFDILNGGDRWILATGFWNDNGIWIDTDFWID